MAAVFGGSPLPAQDSAASSVQADELEAQEANLFRQSIVRLDPMDYTSLDYGLGSVLRNYYNQNFTSAENWEQFQSIRFEGTLELAHGTVRFYCFQEKARLLQGGHLCLQRRAYRYGLRRHRSLAAQYHAR